MNINEIHKINNEEQIVENLANIINSDEELKEIFERYKSGDEISMIEQLYFKDKTGYSIEDYFFNVSDD